MSLQCPKCNSSSINNLMNKAENDFGFLLLNWVEKICCLGMEAYFCSALLFLITTPLINREIFSMIFNISKITFIPIFIFLIIILILIKIIKNTYKLIFIGLIGKDDTNDKPNHQYNGINLIILPLYYGCIGGIIFYGIPLLLLGFIGNSPLYNVINQLFDNHYIYSQEYFHSAIPILIICSIGLIICYNIIKTTVKNSFICNVCGYIFAKTECKFTEIEKNTIEENKYKIESKNNDKNKTKNTIFTEENAKSLISKADNNCKIIIPNNFTSIDDDVFYCNSSLTTIEIPNSITSIGNNAFNNCSSLENITIPDSVISIGKFAFNRCKSLKSITIPNSVKIIGNNAFLGIDTIYYNGTAEGAPWGAKHHIKT